MRSRERNTGAGVLTNYRFESFRAENRIHCEYMQLQFRVMPELAKAGAGFNAALADKKVASKGANRAEALEATSQLASKRTLVRE